MFNHLTTYGTSWIATARTVNKLREMSIYKVEVYRSNLHNSSLPLEVPDTIWSEIWCVLLKAGDEANKVSLIWPKKGPPSQEMPSMVAHNAYAPSSPAWIYVPSISLGSQDCDIMSSLIWRPNVLWYFAIQSLVYIIDVNHSLESLTSFEISSCAKACVLFGSMPWPWKRRASESEDFGIEQAEERLFEEAARSKTRLKFWGHFTG